MTNWYKLDNAAKLFVSIKNDKNTPVFRVAVVLEEEIDSNILQDALDSIMPRFPMLGVSLKRGVFWNYLEENKKRLLVHKESKYPCYKINPKENGEYLIKVLYYKRRLSVEVFHSVADATSTIDFIKSLLYYYLTLSKKEIAHEDKILLKDDTVNVYDFDDSFNIYTKNIKRKTKLIRPKKVFMIKGESFEYHGNNVIHGILSVGKLKEISKEYNVTITAYLVALLIYSIYESRMKYGNYDKDIIVSVPVNLRNIFPSKTLRNFFAIANVSGNIHRNISFEEILKNVSGEMKEKTSKKYLENFIYSNVEIERKHTVKFIPLFIKNFFVNLDFALLEEKRKTITLSNFGNIVLPNDMYKYVRQFEAVLYPSVKSPLNCGVCSVGDRLSITFTRTILETDIIRYFFTFLSNLTDIEIYSNDFGVEK